MAHIWRWWCSARGADPMTWGELKAWSEMTKTSITAQEAEMIMQLDLICRAVMNER